MRIVVFSDSHGRYDVLERIVLDHPEADVFIHLGDGERDADHIRSIFPSLDIRSVRGNCDWGSAENLSGMLAYEGFHVLYTHGHAYNVKFGLGLLEEYARENSADLVAFGHTHLPLRCYEDGLHMFNPGSVSKPVRGEASYGIIDITQAGIFTNIVLL